MADLQEITPQADTRKELLAEQFADVSPTPAISTPQPDTTPTDKTASERVRDETGKFVAKANDTVAKAAKGAAEAAVGGQAAPPVLEDEPAWKRAPPKSWKPEFHEAWQSGNADLLRQYAFQREEEMSRGLDSARERIKFADQVNAVIEPFLPTIRGLGIDAPTAIKSLMQADYTLRNSQPDEKKAYFLKLAQQYGVNLGDGPIPQTDIPNPVVYSLQNELTNIKGMVSSWQQKQQDEHNASVMREINKFAGDPKFEHYAQLEDSMVRLIQGGVVEKNGRPYGDVLQEAYEKALRLDSQLFDAMQQSKQAEAASQKIATADKAAKAARAAAVSVKGSTPGPATTTKAQDRRAMLADQFSNIEGRL